MFTRIVMLMFVAMLALPVATLTRPTDTNRSSWSDSAMAAKARKHKQKDRKRKTRTVTRTVRGPVTQTFTSTGLITIPAGAPGATKGDANPYPSAIEVSGLPNGVITDVDLLLQDFSHAVPEDVDILLSAPDGRHALVMSDVGRIFRVVNIDLTLDDEAAAPLPQTELDSGAFRPTDVSSAGQPPDAFTAPAPTLDGSVALSTFDGADPNGTWRLFVTDDASGDTGDLRAWALRITTEVDTGTVDERVPANKDKKHKKKGKRRR
jgi:hypothetical protein